MAVHDRAQPLPVGRARAARGDRARGRALRPPRGWRPRSTGAPTCACSCATSSACRPISGRPSSSSRSATTPTRTSRPSWASGARRSRRWSSRRARRSWAGGRHARRRAPTCASSSRRCSGGALGRGTLRRHVEQCAGCADYEAAVRRQRAALAIALPVAPAAGLRAAVLGSALGGSGVGAVAGVGGTTGAAGGLAAKLLVAAALVGGAGATGHMPGGESQPRREATAPQAQRVPAPIRAASPAHAATRVGAPTSTTTAKHAATKPKVEAEGDGEGARTAGATSRPPRPGPARRPTAPPPRRGR